MRLGFEQAMQELGIQTKCVLSSEIDKYAQETYELNYKEKSEGTFTILKNFRNLIFYLRGFLVSHFHMLENKKGL
jgi:DNA (cytosine-5)-methyltransferase 1